jgi:hypothetical protein
VTSRQWVIVALVSACGACKPTEAQQASVRARFDAADKADAEPDRAFRASVGAMRAERVDGLSKPCPVEWSPADRSLLVQGVSRWTAEIEITKRPPPRGTLFLQADNVTFADHDAPLDAVGSAVRARRRGLEAELLERKGQLGELDGKEFVARADAILTTPAREIFIDLLYSASPKLDDDDKTFESGFSVARVYLYDHASSRFICAGSFTAESSNVVESRKVLGGQFWLNTNLYLNLVDAAAKALRALPPAF